MKALIIVVVVLLSGLLPQSAAVADHAPSAGSSLAVNELASVYLPLLRGPFDCAYVTEIPQTECEALAAFYRRTDGPHWYSNYGWLDSIEPCSWSGVGCSNGHVITLGWRYFSRFGSYCISNGLRGTLPPELGNLVELSELQLCGNALTGPIPRTLGDLANLRVLALSGCGLTGFIPGDLGRLAELRVLDLSGNQLSGRIPEDIDELSRLINLDLSGNQLSGAMIRELGELVALQTLDLAGNKLSGSVPEQIGGLVYLSSVVLSNNRLSDRLPLTLGNLQNLYALRLDGNAPTLCVPSLLTAFVQNLASGYVAPPGGFCSD